METIAILSQASQSYGPYPKAIRVLVVETKQQEDVLVVGLADKSGVIKAICYEGSLATKLQKNKAFLLRNFQKGRSCLIIHKATQIIPATPFKNIEEKILHQAKCLVNPPPPKLVQLKDIAAPSSGTQAPLLTVCGEVVQDEAPHSVGQGAQEVRNILLQDKDTTIPLALWNKCTKTPVKTGDKVTVTHVSPRNDKFLRKLALSSTSDTTIKIHVPPPSTKTGTITALEEADGGDLSVTLLGDDGSLAMCTLPAQQSTLLLKGTVEETLGQLSDVQYVLSLRGSVIDKMTPKSSEPSTSASTKKN